LSRSHRAAPSPSRLLAAKPHLLKALEGVVPGGVRSRGIDRLAMAHDASHYLLTPQAVVVPTSAEQVAQLMRTSAESGVGLTFRAGGTSLSGQGVTDGILVDTRRNFRDIEVLDGGRRVRVQPGLTVRQVNARLSQYKTKLGPDPASESACTIGGVVANNSSGMSCGIAFNTYQTLESAILVLPSGTVINTAQADADAQLQRLEPAIHSGLLALRERIRQNPHSVNTIKRLYSIKNTMGYGLNSFLDHNSAIEILTHLVIGSEGTLAFVAEATFRTIPIKGYAATGLLVFNDLREATRYLSDLIETNPVAIELLDAASLRVAQRDRQADDLLASIEVRDHAALLVEYQETSIEALTERVNVGDNLFADLPLALPARLVQDVTARGALWHIRKGLYAAVAANRPAGTSALLEDIAVPVAALLKTCEQLVDLFGRHNYEESVIFGHAKDGNIHFMLNERFDQAEQLDRYVAFTEDMVSLVLENSGTLKAEHGTGRVMAPFVRRQYGDELYSVMQEVKRLCDPQNILNPGVLLNEDPRSFVSHLKITPKVEKEVDRCVECGYCEPVCPSQDLTLTPRQRIVMRRELADAQAAGDEALVRELEKEYQYDGIDTCAVDGMCQSACPVSIDTGDLIRRLRTESQSPLKKVAWKIAAKHWGLITRAGGVSLSVAKIIPATFALKATTAARALLGFETVPLLGKDLPRGGIPRKPQTSVNPQAVYFSSCMSSIFGPAQSSSGVRTAIVKLCDRVGVEVTIPEGIQNLCCGTPWKSKGMTSGFIEMRDRVLPVLWESSKGGQLPIIVDGSSCTEGLTIMAESAPIRFRGLRVVDALTFVDEHIMPLLTVRSRLASLALHPTCSSTRLNINGPLTRMSQAVAHEVVIPDGWGCCGFAGDRGMLHPELTASATERQAANLAERDFTAYASSNRTCEIGMSRATGHSYQHILELLEQATR
jgi:D-lactate dehydrogenase